MFTRILVPLDYSPRSERALLVAARLARASGGTVILTHVIANATERWSDPPAMPLLEQESVDEEEYRDWKYLTDVADSASLAGIPTEKVVVYGQIAPTILSVAETTHADLIVLCSHSYSDLRHWTLGSIAETVVHHTSIPVLILREGGPIPAGPHPDATRPLRVLVPLDGSALAKAAIEPAAKLIAALAAPAQGTLHMMRVARKIKEGEEAGSDGNNHELALSKAKLYLHAVTEQLRESVTAPIVSKLQLAITWSVAIDTDVASAILRVAENGEDAEGAGVFGGCDVIAMSTHGRGGFQRWAMGSITERVLHATKLPVLIVRPHEAGDENSQNKRTIKYRSFFQSGSSTRRY
jgi:nucleotide-binding universal stress UspA family protein